MLAPGLSVHINDGSTCRVVNKYASGLRFTKVAPGGHQSIQCQVTLPTGTFPALGPNDVVTVSDQRTGRVIIDGYLKNPTPVDGPADQFYDLNALGGMWRASDETEALIYADRGLDGWRADPFGLASATVEAGVWFGDSTSKRLRITVPGGGVVATGAFAGSDLTEMVAAGMNLGAITFYAQSGKTDVDWTVTLDHIAGSITLTSGMTSLGAGFYLYAGADFPSPTNYVSLRLNRTGAATNIADDATWTDFVNLIVNGQRVDRYGALLTGADMAPAGNVLASQVVEDLLGRLLTMCDPATAVVEATTFPIDQLAYPDGANAATVMSDLTAWESDFTWEILERLPNGLHRMGWRAWPTTPRYVVSVADGWVQTGSDQDVRNRVLVTWTDAAGSTQSLAVTAQDLFDDGLVTAADLDGVGTGLVAGQIRDADRYSLPQGVGSAANAAKIGRGVLLDTIKPPRSGTVTIRRPVIDLLTGNRVMPWEIEPGYVCRVREPGYDLRITQVSYDHDAQEMALTLGSPVLTADQRVARLDAA